jgi:short-subunit dehydrogenase
VRRTVLITGASSGIGEAFADEFARHGYDLVLTARREDRLVALAARLSEVYGVQARVVLADLGRPEERRRLVEEVAAHGLVIDALVNNAGYGVPGPYLAHAWETHEAFLQVLVVAVADLTRRLLPGMLERGHGRIVNVASLAGLLPAPANHTLYAAAKAFVIRFSESLAHESRARGVHVTVVCPGFTFTEFHDVMGTRNLVSRLPGFMWLSAADVARQGYAAVEAGVPAVVTGRVNRAIALAARLLPQTLIWALMRRAASRFRGTTAR